VGYALFLDDGHLGLALGTVGDSKVFMALDHPVADGVWHHVAAVVRRSAEKASALYVDGERVLTFDVAGLDDRGSVPAGHLYIGTAAPHPARWYFSLSRGTDLWNGQLDEVTLLRSAMTDDEVASIFVAGTAGKLGSLGNVPTSIEGATCVTSLGNKIEQFSVLAPLAPLYTEVETAIQDGIRGRARLKLRQLRDLAFALAGPPPEMKDMPTMMFNVAASTADICLQQRDLVL
jgi:hypothetical protein